MRWCTAFTSSWAPCLTSPAVVSVNHASGAWPSRPTRRRRSHSVNELSARCATRSASPWQAIPTASRAEPAMSTVRARSSPGSFNSVRASSTPVITGESSSAEPSTCNATDIRIRPRTGASSLETSDRPELPGPFESLLTTHTPNLTRHPTIRSIAAESGGPPPLSFYVMHIT